MDEMQARHFSPRHSVRQKHTFPNKQPLEIRLVRKMHGFPNNSSKSALLPKQTKGPARTNPAEPNQISLRFALRYYVSFLHNVPLINQINSTKFVKLRQPPAFNEATFILISQSMTNTFPPAESRTFSSCKSLRYISSVA